ncbi:MAG: type II toxin-antitoxin system RelE family toxin [Bacilli bacterium]|jgi:mRNA interferase RelE/StbE
MRYEIEWSQGALKDIRRLDKPLIARITRAIEVFAETGRGDVKRLTNADGAYRLRVGEWRVRFRLVHREIQIMLIQAVLPRGEAYKR